LGLINNQQWYLRLRIVEYELDQTLTSSSHNNGCWSSLHGTKAL